MNKVKQIIVVIVLCLLQTQVFAQSGTIQDQFKSDGITPIDPGAWSTESIVIFKATIDATGDTFAQLVVDYQVITSTFPGTIIYGDLVSTGQVSVATAAAIADGKYMWRWAITNGVSTSAWTEWGPISVPPAIDFGIDANPPSGTMTINLGASYTSTTAVTLDNSGIVDAGSGVAQMQFSNDGVFFFPVDWTTFASTYPWTLPTGDGEKTVYARYKDAVGWEYQTSDTIILDMTPPTGAVSINAGATYTSTTAVTINSSITDAPSGVSEMQFSNDGASWSSWVAYSASFAWNLLPGDGTKTVYARYKDNAGNIYETQDTIKLDTQYPDIFALVSPPDMVVVTVSDVLFEWEPSAAPSGIASYELIISSNPAFPAALTSVYSTNVTSIVLTLSDGQYFWKVRAVANNGLATETEFRQLFVLAMAATETLTGPGIQGGQTTDYYVMFSIPLQSLETGQVQLESQIGQYNPFIWRMSRWIGGIYVEYPGFLPVMLGDGFWFISIYNTQFSFTGKVISGFDRFYIKLLPGWNQIGNPYKVLVAWSNVIVQVDSSTIAVTNTANNYTSQILYAYKQGQYLSSDSLVPFEGYFVKNNLSQPVWLIIPKPPGLPKSSEATYTSLPEDAELPPMPPLLSSTSQADSGSSSKGGCIGFASTQLHKHIKLLLFSLLLGGLLLLFTRIGLRS